ncbi:MAG: DUF1664 domain-containing protein [Magnetococcales bacterium]|nr:hypothetical protein [Magnetococcales bacterium]NGZ25513.1 DUF1664 domain-containing protein [Magnetococcales bacterium]
MSEEFPASAPPSGPRNCPDRNRMRRTMGGDPMIPINPDGHASHGITASGGPECDGCFSAVLDQFAKSFDKSAKRWELIVYPSLFAFIVLAMYGFFLIYSLTQDIRTMAVSIDPKMGVNMGSLSASIQHLSNNIEVMSTHLEYISDNMETMAVDMRSMTDSVERMSENVNSMNKSVTSMNKTIDNMSVKLNNLEPITNNMTSMNQAVHVMAGSMSRMGYDVNSAARPMSFINRFMPW